MRLLSLLCASVLLLGVTSVSEAALVSRLGGQAVYDIDRDITWLADANLADSMTFGVPGIIADGRMSWFTALSWIGSLNATNGGAGYLGFNNWRLPSAFNGDGSGPCGPAFNCAGSEMGHLFYNELGGNANESVFNQPGDTPVEIANLALFSNVQPSFYWSGTEFAPNPNLAWGFGFGNGNQLTDFKDVNSNGFAWAVRSGDVAPVPSPSAMLLFATGLACLIGWKYQKTRS
ncbi:MAG: DUF1566 domain-containing protein [Nitrospirales bacterium]